MSLKRSQFLLWAFLSVLLIVIVSPVCWAILGGFKSNFEIMNKPFALPEKWLFQNFTSAWNLGHFETYFFNSAFITLVGMFLVFLVACPAGYAFAQIEFKGSSLLFYLFIAGLTLPVQTIIIPVFYHLKALGLVNTLWGVILVSVGLALPFSVFLMRNTFRGLPKELRESAYMDGAGEWRTFISIMLPLAKPGVVALLIFTFMGLWNEYLLPLVILIAPEKFTIAVGLSSFQSEQTTNYAVIYAGAVISMIPSILIYILFQRQFTQGVAAGSQKG